MNLPNLDRRALEERLGSLRVALEAANKDDTAHPTAASAERIDYCAGRVSEVERQLKWLDELDKYIIQFLFAGHYIITKNRRLAMRDKVKEEDWFTEAEKL